LLLPSRDFIAGLVVAADSFGHVVIGICDGDLGQVMRLRWRLGFIGTAGSEEGFELFVSGGGLIVRHDLLARRFNGIFGETE